VKKKSIPRQNKSVGQKFSKFLFFGRDITTKKPTNFGDFGPIRGVPKHPEIREKSFRANRDINVDFHFLAVFEEKNGNMSSAL
jgi:hypothetical protein